MVKTQKVMKPLYIYISIKEKAAMTDLKSRPN